MNSATVVSLAINCSILSVKVSGKPVGERVKYLDKEKDVFSSCYQRGKKKKICSPHEQSILRPSDSALRCSTTEPQGLHGERSQFRISYDKRPAYCLDQQCR